VRILHIEDDAEWFERILRPRLEDSGTNEVVYARSKSEGEAVLVDQDIDYVILDLAIPLDDPRGSPSVSHGQDLAMLIRRDYPGVPILILTGQSSEEAAQELEEDDSFEWFWDGERRNLVKIRKKSQLDRALDLVAQASEALRVLEGFELNFQGEAAGRLTTQQRRIIKLFGKCRDATAAVVESVNGGLSDTEVLRVNLLDQNGNSLLPALAKIGHWSLIDAEVEKYHNYSNRLPVGSCPAYIDRYSCGCQAIGGVFFQLATEHRRDFFDVLRQSDEAASKLIGEIRGRLDRWHSARTAENRTVSEIRRQLCTDTKFAVVRERYPQIDWENFENRDLQVNVSVGHGDLHGSNILVSDTDQPVFIDYADIDMYPCSLDPITLELSPFFYPSTNVDFAAPKELAQLWFEDDRLQHIRYPESSVALREWSLANAFLNRELYAVVYAYCARQLTYEDTNAEFALGLIQNCIAKFEDT